ncbi:hypothetical protein H0H87_008808 [Tephrocybe sp. NHM501043]|nr:hypothetical protein H0H87_008808 [Tephrocybe sp. NHM501043]
MLDSDASIAETMRVVNIFYNNISLYFQVAGVYRYAVSYNTLHGVTMNNDFPIKQAYRKGNSPQILNIYTVGTGPSGYAGWSSFPWNYQGNSVADGIIYDYTYLPGSNRAGYNTGKVSAQYTTDRFYNGITDAFNADFGGCDGGDDVDDTPAEAEAATFCQRRDSCPAAPGDDPIRMCLPSFNISASKTVYAHTDNMMDYTDDNCRIEFTNGQYNRLAQMIYRNRGINLY